MLEQPNTEDTSKSEVNIIPEQAGLGDFAAPQDKLSNFVSEKPTIYSDVQLSNEKSTIQSLDISPLASQSVDLYLEALLGGLVGSKLILDQLSNLISNGADDLFSKIDLVKKQMI